LKKCHIISHPLAQHKLTLLRQKETTTGEFRILMREMGMLIGYEVTSQMPLTYKKITTPLSTMNAPVLDKKKMAMISILRAGNGILDGMLQLLPTARVGHIGLYRDHLSNSVVEYYFKLPEDISSRDALVMDPMLATGQSAVAAITRLKEAKPKSIAFICLLAAPEGVEYFHHHHPDVPLYTASVDERLDENGYIIPGMGDAGDRLFGTQ
jgi:uracil phosphoribosyltransferase